jgi:predicted membrane protein
MHIFFAIIAVIFVILGFIGIFGGFTLILWPLAAVAIALAVKTYPRGKKGPKEGPPLHG